MPGSADLCFLIEDSVDDVLARLQERAIGVLEGSQVVDRSGARGKIRSVVRSPPDLFRMLTDRILQYVRDPDGNLIESLGLVRSGIMTDHQAGCQICAE
jgi:hypothetical protein